VTATPLLDAARADSRYHRERLALYRARGYGGGGTTARRLRELELACQTAEERVKRLESGRRSSQ
jgi:hypothetical protein